MAPPLVAATITASSPVALTAAGLPRSAAGWFLHPGTDGDKELFQGGGPGFTRSASSVGHFLSQIANQFRRYIAEQKRNLRKVNFQRVFEFV